MTGSGGEASAQKLDRSDNYVSGRLRGQHALSVDIVAAAAELAGMSARALMTEIMAAVARAGQGSSDR